MIVCELGASHGGDLSRALMLVDAAKGAEADAIKIQTFTADTMVADKSFVIPEGPWTGRNLHELYREASLPWADQAKVFEHAKRQGLIAFSTPFDETAVEFLESIDCPIYKIASFEITDLALIKRVARTGKPLIISTGMATEGEIQEAMWAAAGAGASYITLLKCASAYPADPDHMNLRTIPAMRVRFGTDVGLSDHTVGAGCAVIATALGATIIEKHITLNPGGPGLDDEFAIGPVELEEFVQAIRDTERALGTPRYGPTEDERSSLIFRRSLHIVKDLKAGDALTADNVKPRRPATGMLPAHAVHVLGFTVKQDVPAGTALTRDMIGPAGSI